MGGLIGSIGTEEAASQIQGNRVVQPSMSKAQENRPLIVNRKTILQAKQSSTGQGHAMLHTLSTEGQTSVGAKPIEFGEQDTPLLGPHK